MARRAARWVDFAPGEPTRTRRGVPADSFHRNGARGATVPCRLAVKGKPASGTRRAAAPVWAHPRWADQAWRVIDRPRVAAALGAGPWRNPPSDRAGAVRRLALVTSGQGPNSASQPPRLPVAAEPARTASLPSGERARTHRPGRTASGPLPRWSPYLAESGRPAMGLGWLGLGWPSLAANCEVVLVDPRGALEPRRVATKASPASPDG
jgi:hypothetical protein